MKLILTNFLLFFVLFAIVNSCTKEQQQTIPPIVPDTTTGWNRIKVTTSLNDVFFINDTIGYLAGDKYLAKSIDGGLTWKKYDLPDSMNGYLINIFFTDFNNGWIAADTFILRTTNGGDIWQKIHIDGYLGDIQFFNPMEGYLVSSKGLYKTNNGGVTWTKTPGAIFGGKGLFFINQTTGWIGGEGKIHKTSDAGNSFTNEKHLTVGSPYYIVNFIDAQIGWTTGVSDAGLWRTTDGGINWELLQNNFFNCDVHFFDANNGIVMTGDAIYKTADGGKTLIKEFTVPQNNLIEIHFTNPGHGWAVGLQGSLYRYVK